MNQQRDLFRRDVLYWQAYEHTAQMQQWRREAAELIRQQEMRESLIASTARRDEVLADLKRRAGFGTDDTEPRLAAMPIMSPSH